MNGSERSIHYEQRITISDFSSRGRAGSSHSPKPKHNPKDSDHKTRYDAVDVLSWAALCLRPLWLGLSWKDDDVKIARARV
jgi:hypothetical protein